jgi:hypothetical protein
MSALRSSLKQNSHWVLLGACSLLSTASLWFSQNQLSEWLEEVESLRPPTIATKKIPPADLEAIQRAAESLASPAQWKPDLSNSLFVSERYLVENGVLRNPENASFYRHSDGRPIENSWFNQYPSLAKALGKPRLQLEDSDEDGFTNEEEWAAKTDPTNPKSHPPLRSKLFLVNQTQISHKFRLRRVENLGTPTECATIERLEEPLPEWLQNSKKNADQPKIIQFQRPILKPGQLMGDIKIVREEGNQRVEVSIGEPNLRLVSIDQVINGKVPLLRVKLRDEKSGRERFATKPANTNDSKDPLLVQDADFEVKNIALAYRHRFASKDIPTEPGKTVEISAPNGATEVYKVKDSTQETVILVNNEGTEFEITTEVNRNAPVPANRP